MAEIPHNNADFFLWSLLHELPLSATLSFLGERQGSTVCHNTCVTLGFPFFLSGPVSLSVIQCDGDELLFTLQHPLTLKMAANDGSKHAAETSQFVKST